MIWNTKKNYNIFISIYVDNKRYYLNMIKASLTLSIIMEWKNSINLKYINNIQQNMLIHLIFKIYYA